MKINESEIKAKLEELQLAEGARETKFIKRKGGKITGVVFTLSFFLMLLSKGDSLTDWCLQICKFLDDKKIYTSSLQKKITVSS